MSTITPVPFPLDWTPLGETPAEVCGGPKEGGRSGQINSSPAASWNVGAASKANVVDAIVSPDAPSIFIFDNTALCLRPVLPSLFRAISAFRQKLDPDGSSQWRCSMSGKGGNSGYKDRKNELASFPTAREKGSGANQQSTLFGVSPSPSSAPTCGCGRIRHRTRRHVKAKRKEF